MPISLYEMSVGSFVPMLRALAEILEKAEEETKKKKLAAGQLPAERLAPDMYTLTQQVQFACNHARDAVALLTGTAAPEFADKERTLRELGARVARTISYLDGMTAAKFEGADERKISFAGPPGMTFQFTAMEYLRDWSLPHFYFHLVTAYDILRHKGIDIGKRDYLSGVAKYIKQG